MSDYIKAAFLDTKCMTIFNLWDIDIVHATFIPFAVKNNNKRAILQYQNRVNVNEMAKVIFDLETSGIIIFIYI